jgi:hypothetical protein
MKALTMTETAPSRLHDRKDQSMNSNIKMAQTPTRPAKDVQDDLTAAHLMAPSTSAAAIVMTYTKQGDVGVAILQQLEAQERRLASGSLADAENMLMSQAVALQAIFTRLALRANSANGTEQIQCLLGLALRAQNGCRATLQTLGELKNPRQATFVRQANIAHGQQQVNNACPLPRAHADASEASNKLSGGNHELLQNSGTSGAPVTGDPVVETMGKVHRTQVRRG